MKFIRYLPNSKGIYNFCREYCDRFNGEGNDNIKTNGEYNFLSKHIKQCKTVFDVGANKGIWAKLALNVNPHINLHCFEPIKEMFEILTKNNFPPNVVCNHFGLSSKKQSMNIFLNVQSVYERTGLRLGWGIDSPGRTESIQLESLDDYCKNLNIDNIDFLKCDVEGHEFEIFKGAKEMLTAGKIKRIQFEYGGCNIDARILLKDIFEFFNDLNYSFYKIMPHNLVKIEEYDQRLENFAHKNFAIINKAITV